MRHTTGSSALMIAAITLALLGGAGEATAKGCIKGAIVGGVAGHYAGHHGVLGAAAGCIIGHHHASKRATNHAMNREARERQP
jgi:hypothetical protein